MPILSATSQLYSVKNLIGGLNSFDDQSDVDDSELVNVRNMTFTDGVLQNRQGSLLYVSKPSGETGTSSQMLVATNSNGVDYLIGVYGTNFYLYDTINSQWIKLNNSYSPTTVGSFYGSANWNNGITDDRFFFGNGIDSTMKWVMAVSTLSQVTASSDTSVKLNAAVSFPSSGNLIVMNNGTRLILPYTSIGGIYTASTISFNNSNQILDSANGFVSAGFVTGDTIIVTGSKNNNFTFQVTNVAAGVLTVTSSNGEQTEAAGNSVTIKADGSKTVYLSGTAGAIIPKGSTVTVPMVISSTPIGSVFAKSQGRLFVANAVGAENTIHYSVAGNPESYVYTAGLTYSTGINSGGFYTLFKGKGGILGMTDFGQFLLIEKEDILSEFFFNIASDNSGFTVEVIPVISGDGIGPANSSEILTYMNELYYPTNGEGIVSFSPAQTGVSTSSGLTLLSQKINNLVTEKLNFSISRTCGLAQKLYWAVSLPELGTPATANNIVLMYDLVRAGENSTKSAWTIFDNWNAVDLKPVNNVLYYLSASDGGIYEAYSGYQDAESGVAVPYTSYALTKRYNLNSPATLMRAQYIYLEGFVSQGTTFYVNVLDNEGGSLGSQGYAISGSNSTITSNILVGGMGVFSLGSSILGSVDVKTIESFGNPLFFRVYLEVSQAYREHNIQLLCFSNSMGAQWGISHLTLITQPESSIETALVMSPSTVPVVNIS